MIFAISSKSKRGEAREQLLAVAIAEITQEVRFDVGSGEEIAVDAGIVEA